MAAVVNDIQADFEMWNLCTDIHLPPQVAPQAFPTLTWVDDVVACIEASSEDEVLDKLARAVNITEAAFQSVGLSISMDKGKTEALIQFAGPKAKTARRRLLVENSSVLQVAKNDGSSVNLSVVPSYCHLGGLVAPDATLREETRRRVALAAQALHQLKIGVFRNKGLSVTAKVTFVEATVFSKLLYGAQAWGVLDGGSAKAVNGFYMKALRAATGLCVTQYGQKHSNLYVLAKARCPSLEWQMRKMRLRYLVHLQTGAPAFLSQLLLNEYKVNESRAWLTLVQHDIEAVREIVPDAFNGLATTYTWVQLFTYVARSSNAWNRDTIKACQTAVTQLTLLADLEHWRENFDGAVGQIGLQVERRQPDAPISPLGHRCDLCGNEYSTRQGLSAHQWHAHQISSETRAYTYASHCVVCLVEFHTSHRVNVHLRENPRCMQFCLQNLEPLTGPPVHIKLDSRFKGHKRIPCILLEGPRLPNKLEWRQSNAKDYSPEEIDLFWRAAPALRARRDTRNPSMPGRNLRKAGHTPNTSVHQMDVLAAQDNSASTRFTAQAPVVHPLAMNFQGVRTYFVLHLFSGRDREGSMRRHLEEMSIGQPFRIFVICLDVVHNAKLCNLASDELVAKILALIRSGHILGAQAGPPCETWSRAREVKIADKPNAPRPLRSAHQPWGLPSLRLKEYKQLQISNKLLQTALLVVAHLYACCGVTITEHPGEPSESRLPSIWKLAQVKWLCTLPGVEKGEYTSVSGARQPKSRLTCW